MNHDNQSDRMKPDFWYAIDFESGISRMIFANFQKAMDFLAENEDEFYLQRVQR